MIGGEDRDELLAEQGLVHHRAEPCDRPDERGVERAIQDAREVVAAQCYLVQAEHDPRVPTSVFAENRGDETPHRGRDESELDSSVVTGRSETGRLERRVERGKDRVDALA